MTGRLQILHLLNENYYRQAMNSPACVTMRCPAWVFIMSGRLMIFKPPVPIIAGISFLLFDSVPTYSRIILEYYCKYYATSYFKFST